MPRTFNDFDSAKCDVVVPGGSLMENFGGAVAVMSELAQRGHSVGFVDPGKREIGYVEVTPRGGCALEGLADVMPALQQATGREVRCVFNGVELHCSGLEDTPEKIREAFRTAMKA